MQRSRTAIAIFRPHRCANWAPHVFNHVDKPRFFFTVAALYHASLSLTSLALVMPPHTSRSPGLFREGVRPPRGQLSFGSPQLGDVDVEETDCIAFELQPLWLVALDVRQARNAISL